MNPSTINGGGAINSGGPPVVVDLRTSLPMVNQQVSTNNNTLPSTTPSIGVTIEFADKIESAYIRTRHNNLRCFPQCGKVHKTKSFCGTPLCIRIRRLDASQLWSIKEIQVFGEFRNVRKAPAFSLMSKCMSKMIDQSNFVKGHLSSTRNDFEFTINPPRKWRYRARIAQVLDMHVFTVYVVAREMIVAMKDSPPFQVIPIWKADESMLKGDEEEGSDEEGDEEEGGGQEDSSDPKNNPANMGDSTANKKARPSFDDDGNDAQDSSEQQPPQSSEDHSKPTSSSAQSGHGSNKEGFHPKPTTSPPFIQPSSTAIHPHPQEPTKTNSSSNGQGTLSDIPQNLLNPPPITTMTGGSVFNGSPPPLYPMAPPHHSPSLMMPPSFQQSPYFPSYSSSSMTKVIGPPFQVSTMNPLQTSSQQPVLGSFPLATHPSSAFSVCDPRQQQLQSSSFDGSQQMSGTFTPSQPATTTTSSSFMSDPSLASTMFNYPSIPGNGVGNGSGLLPHQGMMLPSASPSGLPVGDGRIITNLLASAYMMNAPSSLNTNGGMLGGYPGGQYGPSFMPPQMAATQYPYSLPSPSNGIQMMNGNKMGMWQQSMMSLVAGGGGSQVIQGPQQHSHHMAGEIAIHNNNEVGTSNASTSNGFPSNLAGQTMHLASGKDAKEKHQD